MRREGFTLVEMLVALSIFGMLAAGGVALLSFSVRAQEAADVRLDSAGKVRRLGALLGADLAQAAARPWRDEAGRAHSAFTGDSSGFSLVRGGWDNPGDAPRPSLQRVEYRLAEGRLERTAWPMVDGAEAMAPAAVAEGVRSMRVRYRDRLGHWQATWAPTRAAELPVAVEIVLEIEGKGAVRQLFLAGTGQRL